MLNFTSLDHLGGNRVRQLIRRLLRLRDD